MTDPTSVAVGFQAPDRNDRSVHRWSRPLVSRVQWEQPDGSTATWESRQARKRGFIEIVRDGVVQRIRVRPAHAVRLARCNAVSGVSFFLGGALFTIGAVLSQLSSPARPPSTGPS